MVPTFFLNGTAWLADGVNKATPQFRTTITLDGDSYIPMQALQSYPWDQYYARIYIFATDAHSGASVPLSMGQTAGLPVGFMSQLKTGSTSAKNPHAISIDVTFSRGLVVRMYAVIIIISIWLITLVVLAAFIFSIILGRKLPREVMIVPITTLFTFTQLRETLPGAPVGFGAIIDFVGILPCLALLSICSVGMIGIFLFRNPEVNRTEPDVHTKLKSV